MSNQYVKFYIIYFSIVIEN